jgi:hypothetical protein
VRNDAFFRGPDDGKIVATTDQRGIIIIEKYPIADSIQKSGNDMTGLPDTITRFTADKNRYLFHDVPPGVV